MNVYIQKENEELELDYCFYAYHAFKEYNWWLKDERFQIKTIKMSEIKNCETGIYVGSVDFTEQAFQHLGIKNNINFSGELLKAPFDTNRNIWTGYITDIKAFPVFVKPYDKCKLFAGTIIESAFEFDCFCKPATKETKLLISDVIAIHSEYRLFIYNGETVAIKHYKGDPCLSIRLPDETGLDEFCSQFWIKNCSAYTIDIGITDVGLYEPLYSIIEYNDIIATGTYGFGGIDYAKMLAARWLELYYTPAITENSVLNAMEKIFTTVLKEG